MKIALVVGTRPEIIKMMPLVKYCKENSIDYFLIHSNQHYSENMDKVFFEELQIPLPKYNLKVGSGKHSNMTGNILIKIEPILEDEKPDVLLVQGDTNTVLAGALAASKLGIKVGHVEAGLRSYDRTMPEETNRIATDHISDFLFAVTKKQEEILLNEGIDSSKIHVVGNTVVDALLQNKELSKEKSNILRKLNIENEEYFLITIHRASNVDYKDAFNEVASILNELPARYDKKVIWPIHPRSKKYLDQFQIKLNEKIILTEPCGYLDFIQLQSNASLILTDSGGIQEEACSLSVPCITLRSNTERPETVDVGSNVLVGRDKKKAFEAIDIMLSTENNWINPFGDGHTTESIFKTLSKHFNFNLNVNREKKVSVIGLGYMGLPMAAIIANAGYEVTGVDLDTEKIQLINDGMCPFSEKGMDELVSTAIASGNLKAQESLTEADIYLLSLPTNKINNKCDLSSIVSVCKNLKDHVKDGDLIIIESTIKPNTIKEIVAPIFEEENILLSHCPERAIPGNTLYELINNDRIIGGLTKEASDLTYEFYDSFIKGKLHITDATSAECSKLMENTYRDVNIALANEFDMILNEKGLNSLDVINLANKHPRVNILKPGAGVGGHCIAVDPWFLVEDTSSADLILTARKINDDRPIRVVERIRPLIKEYGNKIGVLGVAYKPNVDDTRETPVLDIVKHLQLLGAEIKCHDPNVINWDYELYDIDEVLNWSDFLLVTTFHSEFKSINHENVFYCNNLIIKETK